MRLIAFPQWDKLTSLLRGMARQPVLLVIVAQWICHFEHTEMNRIQQSQITRQSAAVCRLRGKGECLFHSRSERERTRRPRMGGGNVQEAVAGRPDSMKE